MSGGNDLAGAIILLSAGVTVVSVTLLARIVAKTSAGRRSARQGSDTAKRPA